MGSTGPASTGRVLAEAFHDDAMFRFVEPDDRRRAQRLPWFFAATARLGRQQGRLDEMPGRGAAVWLTPGSSDVGPLTVLRSGLVLAPLRLGPSAFGRFTRITSAFEEAGRVARQGRPTWHLFILGVAPAYQGQGIGRQLIAPVLELVDAAHQQCYLETLEQTNLSFYRALGFEVASEHDLPGLPRFWTMIRPPRTTASVD